MTIESQTYLMLTCDTPEFTFSLHADSDNNTVHCLIYGYTWPGDPNATGLLEVKADISQDELVQFAHEIIRKFG